jgi:hypothetical protein
MTQPPSGLVAGDKIGGEQSPIVGIEILVVVFQEDGHLLKDGAQPMPGNPGRMESPKTRKRTDEEALLVDR